MRKIAILGSTGSIGTQALDVCENLGFGISVLTARRSGKLLEQQVRKFRPKVVAVIEPDCYRELKLALADLPVTLLSGEEGLCEAASMEENDVVLNAVVGIAGLKPTLAALSSKKPVALANKETLVSGGKLVMETARENGVQILPVDSEHSAIFQCLQGLNAGKEVEKILLTASGGPFFGKTREQLQKVQVEDALKHPNWAMGSKITIDSATLMNKGLELIEACWLFDKRPNQIEIIVHRESIIHSMIQCVDGAVLAQLGVPDMRLPIQYALTYPQRQPMSTWRLSFQEIGKLTFFSPDVETFRCLRACIWAAEQGGLAPCIANGANEQAVELFLDRKISFLQIGEAVEAAVSQLKAPESQNLQKILEKDQEAREFVRHFCRQ